MIINKFVEIKISSSNFKWYTEKGYNSISKGDILKVKIDDLSPGSAARIEVKCHNCETIKDCQYNNYKNQTKKHNFYVCQKCNNKKTVLTSLEKYGCEYPFIQNEDSKDKAKKSLLKKYGVDNISKTDFMRERKSELMKINQENYNNIIYEKYGCNVSKLDFIKEKKKKTMIKKWGVENPSQNTEIFEKSQKSGKKLNLHEIGLWYRGTYEQHFLDFCLFNKIDVKKGPTILFRYDDKNKYYHSDYFIPNLNLVVEIKSSYYLNKFYEINQAKAKSTIQNGFKHIFIVDKDYTTFENLVNLNSF